MNDTGRPHEGWMVLVPLAALAIFVVMDTGGPKAFVHTATYWLHDLLEACMRLFS